MSVETQTSKKEEKGSFELLLNESFAGREVIGTVIKGTIITLEEEYVLIDVGLKSEGRVNLKEFGGDANDTGSPEVQIAIITNKIRNITDHLKVNRKDNSGRRGLILLVSQRRKLLNYVKKSGLGRYKKIIEKLNIRK